jgi:hypothetical protein
VYLAPQKRAIIMGLNLENINEQVNGNQNTPATEAAAATPATDLAARVAEALKPDVEGKLAAALAEIESLKAARAAQDDELLKAKLRTISDDANKPLQPVGSGQQEIALARAVQAAGGLAKFNLLSDVARCESIGIEGSEKIPNSEIQKYFGAKSQSALAAQLQKNSPKLYEKYRGIFRARNLR